MNMSLDTSKAVIVTNRFEQLQKKIKFRILSVR